MNMRAASFASILAISLAGVACSEKAPAETEAPETASEPEAGQFNLRYPTNGGQPASAEGTGEFNLRIPDSAAEQPGGVRLPEGAVRQDGLSGVQEIQTPPLPETAEPDEPAEPDDIIRLD